MKLSACLILPTVFIIALHSLQAQSDTIWTRTYSGGEWNESYSVQQTSDGGFIVVGYTYYRMIGKCAYVIRTDASGDTVWTRTFGGSGWEKAHSVQQTSDGNFIVAGVTRDSDSGNDDVWLIRLDTQGDTIWTRTYDGIEHDYGYSVQQTGDGGFVIAGVTNSLTLGGGDVWLLRADAQGDTMWTRTYGCSKRDYGMYALETKGGGFILAGTTQCLGTGDEDVWLIRTDAQGDTIWTRIYEGRGSEFGYCVHQTSDSGFVLVGYTSLLDVEDMDAWLIRTNAQGDTLWTRTYGGPGLDFGSFVLQTDDGGFILAGSTESFGAGKSDVWLIRTDMQGDTIWTRTYGGTEREECYSIQQTSDGGFIMAGQTKSFSTGDYDIWLIKTDALGNTGPLEIVGDGTGEIPQTFSLSQNYPNPFNPTSTIRYDLPWACDISLIVYDILGREVARLLEGYTEPGYHQTQWDGRNANGYELPSGIYIARLVTPEYTRSIKMVLLR